MMEEFLAALKEQVPAGARIMLCQFRGDPYAEWRGKWRARVINDVSLIDEQANVYLCVSAMGRNARGEFRRRKENFAGGLLLMIDDVGSGAGSKFPLATLDPLPPTALIETSPNNFQAVYFFKEAVTNAALFDALIRAFIRKQFLGRDTGQAGVNRVFRPPAGINGKAKYNGWKVRMTDWHPERRYSVGEIAHAYGLELVPERRAPRGATVDRGGTIRAFLGVRAALRAAGMLKSEHADLAGWIPVNCPWTAAHTNSADNGAAIREPDDENGWTGAFKCHHGHCEQKGWRDLTDWLNEEQTDLLRMINANALRWSDYKINTK